MKMAFRWNKLITSTDFWAYVAFVTAFIMGTVYRTIWVIIPLLIGFILSQGVGNTILFTTVNFMLIGLSVYVLSLWASIPQGEILNLTVNNQFMLVYITAAYVYLTSLNFYVTKKHFIEAGLVITASRARGRCRA